ncbi:MAG: TonB-dependent receptor [Prevotella sp.]|nr:TonB-dependent receptor [Prevotella sp.]
MKKNYCSLLLTVTIFSAVAIPTTADEVPGNSAPVEKIVNGMITGRVTDDTGRSLPGVNILDKATGQRSVTNEEGMFSIATSTDNDLAFSYIGYFTTTMKAGKMPSNIVMREDLKTLGEVVVTTQKKSQSSIDVPIALSAISGATLGKLNLQQFDEVAQFTPGVEIQIQSPNNPGYVIRGVTSDDGAAYSQPRVSLFQDGVSISRSRASVVELFDLERVEVAKGPQGTLFGRGAEIGGISVVRNKPINAFTGEITANYGSYNQRHVSGFLNTPVVNGKLANRFAFDYDAHDGFIRNLAGGRLNGKSALAFRNSTRWWINDRSSMTLILDYQHDGYPGTSFHTGNALYGNADYNSPANLEAGKDLYIKRDVGGGTLLIDHTFNDQWKLSSITGLRAFRSDERFDADGTWLPLLLCQEKAKGIQASQELRLNYDDRHRFSGFAGASYFFEDSRQEVYARTDMTYLYPLMIQPRMKSQFEGLIEQVQPLLSQGLPAAMQPMVGTMLNQLMAQWFPDITPVDAQGNVAQTTRTPNIYGDLKSALAMVGMDLDAVLTSLGDQGTTLLYTLKGLSDQNLPPAYDEQGTNYGTNQAAEIFADGTFKLTKSLSFTLGLRGSYEHQESGYSSTTVPSLFGSILFSPTTNGQKVVASDDYFSWVGRAALSYNVARNNFYISVSRGRRPGVIYYNNSPEDLSTLKPEIIYSYEAGAKGSLLQGRLNYDLSFYYYDWYHFQTSRFDSQQSKYIADDAGRAHSLGAEVALSYTILPGFNVFGNYAYIDGKFNDTDEDGVAQEYAGHRFRLTPKHSFSVGLDLSLPLNAKSGIFFRPTYSYKSKVFFEDSNEPELVQDGYGLCNFVAGYRIQPARTYYEFSLFGKNIFDKKYIIDAGNSGRQIGFPTFVGGTRSVIGVQMKVGF